MIKNKYVISNAFLLLTVLFSMLFQSFDSYTHLQIRHSEEHCHHKHNGNNSELTHQHHGFDHCSVCEFTFASFIQPDTFSYQLQFAFTAIPYFAPINELPVLYSRRTYSLRGPPFIIV